MKPPAQEQGILNEALDALRNIPGLRVTAELLVQNQLFKADALLRIDRGGRKEHFLAEVKNVDRRMALGQVKLQLTAFIGADYPQYRPLLVTQYLTPDLIDECHKLDLHFIDAAGNMYIDTDFMLLDIRGRKRPENFLKYQYKANNPAGLKIIFALLCKPELVDAPYREIAQFARVAIGTVGPVLKDLMERGYLAERRAHRDFARRNELLEEWVTFYPANLKPTLDGRRFQADREKLVKADLGQYGAYWGGEYGAEKLTRHLRAERFTIYVPGAPPRELMANARMQRDPDGNTEILHTFWHPDLVKPPKDLAPTLLIYADLIATAIDRNLDTAKEVYERFLKTPQNQ